MSSSRLITPRKFDAAVSAMRSFIKQKGFINPGTYKGSTMIFNSYQDYLNDIKNADDRRTFYGINQNPFHKQLEDSISELYNCNDTVLSPSGLASIIIPFFSMEFKNDLTDTKSLISTPFALDAENTFAPIFSSLILISRPSPEFPPNITKV